MRQKKFPIQFFKKEFYSWDVHTIQSLTDAVNEFAKTHGVDPHEVKISTEIEYGYYEDHEAHLIFQAEKMV